MPRLYVTKLHPRVNESDLKRLFGVYGNIRDITLRSGHAFLHFDNIRDAELAFCHLNGKEVFGWRILIEHDRKPSDHARRYAILSGSGGSCSSSNYRKCDHANSERGDRHHGSPKKSNNNKYICNRDKHSPSKDRDSPRRGHSPPIRTRWQVRLENVSSRICSQDLKDYIQPLADISYAEAHTSERGVATFCLSAKCDLKDVIRKIDGAKLDRKRVSVASVTESSQLRRRTPPSHSQSRSRSRSQSSRSTHSRSTNTSRSSSFSSSSRSRSRSRSITSSRSASLFWTRSRSRSSSRSYAYA